jgi:acarbose 7IV-phosphotransferase
VSKILVCGLINIETTLRVDGFPIDYFPVRYPFGGIKSTVSGVGYNIAKALTTLGDTVRFASLIGQDMLASLVRASLDADAIPQDFVVAGIDETAQSVILYAGDGRRQIHVDLKDLQEQDYPPSKFDEALVGSSLAVLCNINFSRPFLPMARQQGVPVATDVHAISDLEDAYNGAFMEAADILFMSDELLPTSPEDWARQVLRRYKPEIVVIGLGAQGALLAIRSENYIGRIPPVYTRDVVNTIGAGDALFSAFIHVYAKSGDPYEAIRKAMVFASYKIGDSGAAEGFLSQAELDTWYTHMRMRHLA